MRQPIDQVVSGLETKSSKIRALARAGYLRTEIKDIVGVRYQHVRKVLVDAGIVDGKRHAVQAERESLIVQVSDEPAPLVSPDVLIKGGFRFVGDWVLNGDEIALDGTMPREPGVYAFVEDDAIVYVGLTQTGLRTRMGHYKRGHERQRTSARVKSLIQGELRQGRRISVLIATPEPKAWNNLPVNTAAGLEAGLIELIKPLWNIQGKSRSA